MELGRRLAAAAVAVDPHRRDREQIKLPRVRLRLDLRASAWAPDGLNESHSRPMNSSPYGGSQTTASTLASGIARIASTHSPSTIRQLTTRRSASPRRAASACRANRRPVRPPDARAPTPHQDEDQHATPARLGDRNRAPDRADRPSGSCPTAATPDRASSAPRTHRPPAPTAARTRAPRPRPASRSPRPCPPANSRRTGCTDGAGACDARSISERTIPDVGGNRSPALAKRVTAASASSAGMSRKSSSHTSAEPSGSGACGQRFSTTCRRRAISEGVIAPAPPTSRPHGPNRRVRAS
jgi:hypothetical protein